MKNNGIDFNELERLSILSVKEQAESCKIYDKTKKTDEILKIEINNLLLPAPDRNMLGVLIYKYKTSSIIFGIRTKLFIDTIKKNINRLNQIQNKLIDEGLDDDDIILYLAREIAKLSKTTL